MDTLVKMRKKKLKVEPSGMTVVWVLETFPRLTLGSSFQVLSRVPPAIPLSRPTVQPAVQEPLGVGITLSGHPLRLLSMAMARI